jgi:hypothetical protein
MIKDQELKSCLPTPVDRKRVFYKNVFMRFLKPVCFFTCFLVLSSVAYSQQETRIIPQRCGTMETLELQWRTNPSLKKKFEEERDRFNTALRAGSYRLAATQQQQNGNRAYITIPIVFHIVLPNPALVTDAQVLAQLDTLNKDYAGLNGDSVKVPSWFKSVFGQSGIQFCLAQQTPNGEPTTGIERIATTKTSFSNADNGVKHASTGGADNWDPSSYFNVWICPLSNQILGYATFPGSGPDNEQGVVADYRSLPGGSLPGYNGGKTITHETGHYFNLYHIWGDDDGLCTGSDFIDDTPNQANSSSACSSGIKTDNCTPSGTGIMYQNYMDYTLDDCLVMFTVDQVARMESALVVYRASLLNSSACKPSVSYNLDAQLKSIVQPAQRICAVPFVPVVTIRNRGVQQLTSLTITTVLDNTVTASTQWTGALPQLASTVDSLKPVTASAGNHILQIYISNPNNGADQNTINDTLTVNFLYSTPVTTVSESFEGTQFPPAGWDIVNPDNAITWQKVTGVAKTGNSSVVINNLNYSASGQQDYLRLPVVNLSDPDKTLDSAFISFQVAAATYTDINTSGNTWDTLEVVASIDCGQTYTSLYKKYGSNLVTRRAHDTLAFVPSANEWRKDSINISNYIGTPGLLLAFKNTTGFENNIYLDDVNVQTFSVNKNLKSRGFLVTPNPTRGNIIVQFYPQPADVRAIQVFNINGQKVAETIPAGQSNYYALDISRYSAGIYIVRVVKGNEVLVKKILKY